jgi:hypothetical protein
MNPLIRSSGPSDGDLAVQRTLFRLVARAACALSAESSGPVAELQEFMKRIDDSLAAYRNSRREGERCPKIGDLEDLADSFRGKGERYQSIRQYVCLVRKSLDVTSEP